nr:hypothetical protein [Planctomycetota bacterium]
MAHPHFSDVALSVLTAADRWRLVSTLVPTEIQPIERRARAVSHAHPHQEVLLPLVGRGVYGHGEHAYPCDAGVVFFFDRFEPHDNGYAPEVRHATHLWISIVEDRAFARTLEVVDGRMLPGGLNRALRPEDLGLDLQRAIADARRVAVASPGLARARLM